MTRDELEQIARTGAVGAGAVAEELNSSWFGLEKDAEDRAIPTLRECQFAMDGLHAVAPIIPLAALKEVSAAFDQFDQSHGKSRPRALADLVVVGKAKDQSKFEVAIGLGLAMRWFRRQGDGFVRVAEVFSYQGYPDYPNPHPDVGVIEKMIPTAKAVFAARNGRASVHTPPIQAFGLFLHGQGWSEYAAWWTLTAAELSSMSDVHQPTAVCVLAGALLEAALVAVAGPAQQANEWNRNFLREAVDRWKVSQLIEQAEQAKTFPAHQVVLAKTLVDFRNRIHAGRFAPSGTAPVPRTNTHEAELARMHLNVLLSRLLEWPPIAALIPRP